MRTSPRQQPTKRFRYSPLIAALACALGTPAALATTFSVTSAADSGTGSLREAIDLVNVASNCATTGGHVIDFGPFTVASPAVIYLSGSLPSITCNNVEIRGEYKAAVTPQSFLYGGLCAIQGAPTAGLTKVTALQVFGFSYGGVGAGMCGKLDARDNKVHGNQRGFDLLGGSSLTNNEIYSNTYGVYVTGSSSLSQNTIRDNSFGGVIGGDGMVLTDNFVYGTFGPGISVGISATFTGNTVHSNSGSAGIYAESVASFKGNRVYNHVEGTGIEVESGTIGGPAVADRNFVYGNGTGIRITGNVTVQNNYIGTPDGTTASGNYTGINIYSTGASAWSITGNVISGNNNSGISVTNASAGSITNNHIGVNAAGTAALPNSYGIRVDFSYGGPLIDISNNVVSGNVNHAIDLYNSTGIQLSGNKIGTNALGNASLPNSEGIQVSCSRNITITANTASGNLGSGMHLSGLVNSQVSSNLVGVGSDGVTQLPNNADGTVAGIYLESTDCFFAPNGPTASGSDLDPKVAGSGTKVLSVNTLSGNTVAYNTGDGIFIYGGTGNNITGGSIHSNSGKNINLDFTGGPLPNDPLDPDTGPNNRQNYPVITGVTHNAGSTVIDFTFNSTPITTFSQLDFYSNPAAGSPAGSTFIGTKTNVGTDLNGIAIGQAMFTGTFSFVSATATGTDGTSEFSPMSTAALTPAATITPSSINFGEMTVGFATANQTITIASSGTAPYRITSLVQGGAFTCPGTGAPICSSGDFICSTDCKPYDSPLFTEYANGNSCTITAGFQPNTAGSSFINLLVCDNTSAAPRSITLSGTGAEPQRVDVLPSPFNFGSVLVGAPSGATQQFSVYNPFQLRSVNLGPITSSGGEFTIEPPPATTCGATLAPNSFCSVSVTFRPAQEGARSGTFTIPVNEQGASPAVVALQGTGLLQSVFTLPPSVDFGSPILGSATLVTRTLTVTNTGNGPLVIGSVTATAPFQVQNPCTTSIAPNGGTCTLTLTFPPTVFGGTNGTLVIASNAPGGDRTVNLLANITAVPYSMAPVSQDFGPQMVGVDSAPRTFTLSNAGSGSIPLGLPAAGSDFLVSTTTCGANLAANSTCTTDVIFRPLVAGPRSGTLSIPVTLQNAPVAQAGLAGSGIEQAILTLPTSIDFGNSVLGGVTVARSMEIRNTGNVPLAINGIVPSVPFTMVSTCSTSLAANAACMVNLSFPPTAFGPASGTLSVMTNAPGGTRVVSLLANVNTIPYAISPTQTDFGLLAVGTESAPRSFTLSNSAVNDIPLGTVTAGASFRVVSSTCPGKIPAVGSCTVDASFLPSQPGVINGPLTVPVNMSNAPSMVATLNGTGAQAAVPVGDLPLPTGIDFGTAVLASNSLRQTLEIRNTGNGNVDFTSIAATPPFELSNACPARLTPGASCTVSLQFPPLVFGNTTGQLTIASNSASGNRVITLLATVDRVPYGISPATFDFGTHLVGTRSATHAFIISNNGDNAIPLARVTTTGAFRVASSTCGATMAPRGSCTAEVSFDPVQAGLASGVLMAEVSLTGAPPARAGLAGTGLQQAGLALPTSIDFGTVTLGSTTALTQTLELRNTGNAVLTFTIAVSGPFTLASNCGLNLLPGGACTVTLTFAPTAVGEFTGSLAVVSNAPGGSRSIALIARVQPRPLPNILVTPSVIGFGDRIQGTISATQRLTITNDGGTTATLGPLTTSPHYIINSQCGATLAPQASCTADIAFRPMVIGPRAFRLEITSNAPSSPNFVDLLGRGCTPPRPRLPPRCS